MKKLVAALVVLAMILAMAPAVFAADEMEITGSVTDKFVGTFTATSDGSLTLNVESVDEGYGYKFDVWNVTKEELVDTIVSNEATAQAIALTADNVYEITVEYVQYWNANLYLSASGTVDCTLTYSGTGTLASDGGDEIAADVIIPEGSQSSNEYTWTATEAGTVTVSVSDLQGFDAYTGEWQAAPSNQFMMGFVNLVVNGETQTSDTCTLDVAAGDTVTVSLFSYMGNQYAANIVCTLEPAQGEEGGSEAPDADVVIPEGSQYSNEYTWTADKTGTLTIGVSTLYQYAIVDYETGEGVWEDAGAMADMAFYRGGLNYVVNGEIFNYSPTVTLDVAAGDNVTVGLHHYMGNQYAADLTFSVEESSGDEGGETTPDGSSEAPYVIESIPYTIEQSGEHDVYYVWTPDVDGTILISRPTGNYVSSLPNYEEVGDYYLVEVVAGEQITLNPWGSNSGSYTIDWYNGEDLEVEPDGSPNAPYVIDAIPYTATYAADNYGYDEYYVWTADKSGTLTVTYPAGGVVSISGAEWEKDEENLTYIVEAEQGAEIVFNFWTSLSAGGDYVIAWAEDDGGEEIAPNDCDVQLPGEVISSGKEFLSSNDTEKEYYKLSWTAPADGILHVHMCEANPGWAYGIDGLTNQHSGTDAATHTYTVLAGTTYDITVKGYDCITYSDGDSEVAWIISFEAAEVEVPKEEYIIIDDIITEEGTYEIGMEYADVTIVTFAPSVEGIYTVTVNGQAVIGNYGGGSWYIYPSESVNHGTSLEWICADAPEVETDTILDENWQEIEIERINDGQGLMIGIKPDSEDVESVEITIEKTGEYVEEEIELEIYVNQAELNQFELGDLVVGDYVDVYGEDHTAVLGEDGYYHLDSADGDILLVDMDYLAVLTDALSGGRGVMYAYVVDENGEITAKYDIADAVKAYEAVCDENGYYPLTEDLLFFYQVYAVGNGVPDYVLEEGFNEQCAWMFACITAEAPTSEEGKPGDTALAAVIGLMAVSAMGITVIVSKKKEF